MSLRKASGNYPVCDLAFTCKHVYFDFMSKSLSVTLIGTGAVATALAHQMARRHINLHAIIGRTSAEAARLGKKIRCRRTGVSPELAADSDLLIFAVPDVKIGDVAQNFTQIPYRRRHIVWAHTSGSLPATALKRPQTLEDRISTVSMHPLQTFVSPNTRTTLDSVVFGIEGEPRGLRTVRQFIRHLGCQTVTLKPNDKLAYHIAAVMASNFLVGLQDAAKRLYRSIGISAKQSQKMMQPLTDQTLTNIRTLGTSGALTGPAKRGDTEMIETHERFLREHHAEIAPVYEHMSNYCRLMSKKESR
jgi:predicted short-subunit dehydrogenase-like oxidoreductase (DUF2520 family)